jgi:colanic acid biosynthesis protein WcaH
VLAEDDFRAVVRLAPLVSIDLVIRNGSGNVLLGLRTNEPARGFYFVPGGRILKNERVRDAFARILNSETGCSGSIDDARLLGVYDHIYDSNRFGDPGFGTHYVVLAYTLCWPTNFSSMTSRGSIASTANSCGGQKPRYWHRVGFIPTPRRMSRADPSVHCSASNCSTRAM